MYKSFFGIFPSFDMFCKVMDACTENYECLVLDNTVKSNKIQDCVFWYKATVRKNFRVGGPDLWRLHKKMYNPKHFQQKEDDAKKANKKTNLKWKLQMIKKRILIVSPHPDDETLGVGGTIAKYSNEDSYVAKGFEKWISKSLSLLV